MDNLEKAKNVAEFADANVRISELSDAAVRRASMYALLDIAESLRALRAPEPDPEVRSFGDRKVRTVNLADLPLESVGGVDDE